MLTRTSESTRRESRRARPAIAFVLPALLAVCARLPLRDDCDIPITVPRLERLWACHGAYAAGDFRMAFMYPSCFDPARDDSGGAQFGSGLVLPTALSSRNWPFGS